LCEFGTVLASKTVTQNRQEKVEIKMTTIKASFDVTTLEGQMKVFNAQNGASQSLKNLESGIVIPAVGVLQYEETIDSYGKEQSAVVTVIFAEDGTSYAGVSDTVAKAGEKLIGFIQATKVASFNVKIVKAKSGKGNEFLNLQLV
jgi:hypothetical protein